MIHHGHKMSMHIRTVIEHYRLCLFNLDVLKNECDNLADCVGRQNEIFLIS